jgi:phosphatidylglycerol lysyltransferase
MLLGLDGYVDAPTVVGAIVVFRLYYYIIPLFLAGSLFAGNEIVLRGGTLLRGRAPGAALSALARWSEPDFAIGAATGVVVMCGALLLLLSVVAPQPDFGWIDPGFADLDNTAAPFVASLIGAGLMVLAIGLSQRVTLAWGSTIVLLLFGAVYTTAQGQEPWVAIVLVLSVGLVAPFRKAFYRHAHLLRGALHAANLVPLVALIVCAGTLALFDRRVSGLEDASWWSAVLSPDLPNSWRATLAVVVVVGLLAIWHLIRPDHVVPLPWGRDARLRYAGLGGVPPCTADGMVMGEAERAAMPYRHLDGVLLGLGDPVGAESDRASVIWRLRDLAQQEGLDAAVWRAGGELLKIYSDLGLTALPLGDDLMPRAWDPNAPPRNGYLCCVAERDLHRLLPLLPVLAAAELQAAK